jgi:hypothetical protein
VKALSIKLIVSCRCRRVGSNKDGGSGRVSDGGPDGGSDRDRTSIGCRGRISG